MAEGAGARTITRIVRGQPTTDGAGVQLMRLIGQPDLPMLDPFLLLDAFRSDRPGDYIAGFPPHPHRGFETVTYLLAGRIRHRDSAGHEGVIEPGGVQWMTAGRGIVHSEMPEQEQGLLEGFQLWVNLPAKHKFAPPRYQEFPAEAIPVERRGDGAVIKVIAGETSQGLRGPVDQPLTEPLYLDVQMPPGGLLTEPIPDRHQAFIHVIQGRVEGRDDAGQPRRIEAGELAILDGNGEIALWAGGDGARLLLIAGKPLGEPVARGGPFVMNTREQVQQAYEDFEAGRFTSSADH